MPAPLSVYVHVPFCSSRCGYCDFNTYTATELGGSVTRDDFHERLMEEVRLARRTLGPREVSSVFFGGGTPTLLSASALGAILDAVRAEFGLAADAEITTEANPDSVTPSSLRDLREAGFTRVSLGMQSGAEHVLRALDRTHTPGSSVAMARAAREAGFEHVNLDLIYGTPGETDDDVRASIAEVVDAGVDHVSAYALIVEEGTPLARRIRRGEMPMPDDDVAADRYELVDDLLTEAGFSWYEVSNWSRPGGRCRHNTAYWQGEDWWGVGPGAHSHVAGRRWWNVKHPRTYADRLAAGSPMEGDEVLTAQQRHVEDVMLGIRMVEGLPVDALDVAAVDALIGDGLLERRGDRVRLTRRGRLLANRVIGTLVG